jgi:hypothetical protein
MAGESILIKQMVGCPNQQTAKLLKHLGLQSRNVAGLFYLLQRIAKKASGSLGSSESRMEKRGIFPLHCSRRLIDVMSNNGLSKNISASTAELSGVRWKGGQKMVGSSWTTCITLEHRSING